MENINLEQAIQQYNTALTELENLVQSPSPAQVIEVLIARDRVNSVLEMLATSVNYPPLSAQSLEEISKIDTRLKAKAQAIALFTESTSFRASFHPKEQAWWWFLEAPKTAWSDRFDWLCSGVSVTCLTVSLGLIGDISPRFLTGVPDAFGAVTVSTQSILTLLVAGGALTKIGQESLRQLLKTINIPERYWHELGAVTSLLVVLGLFSFRQSLPQIATNFYTNPGIESRKKGDWSSAEEQFRLI